MISSTLLKLKLHKEAPWRFLRRYRKVPWAHCYGIHRQGIKSRRGKIFRVRPGRLRGQTILLYKVYRIFPGLKCRAVMLTTYPSLVPKLQMGWSYTSVSPLWLHWHYMGRPSSLPLWSNRATCYSYSKNNSAAATLNAGWRAITCFVYPKKQLYVFSP
jgi:hypothetical protein